MSRNVFLHCNTWTFQMVLLFGISSNQHSVWQSCFPVSISNGHFLHMCQYFQPALWTGIQSLLWGLRYSHFSEDWHKVSTLWTGIQSALWNWIQSVLYALEYSLLFGLRYHLYFLDWDAVYFMDFMDWNTIYFQTLRYSLCSKD